jgi:serine/threonine protein kinase
MALVALKVARADDDHAVYQDLLRHEVETLRRLSHPGVVQLYPVLGDVYAARDETFRGQPWLFGMEYLAGSSLAVHMRHVTRRFPLAWRLQLYTLLLDAVVYLHAQSLSHGDLKPDHILLRGAPARDQTPQPVLIDFGSSCSLFEPPPQLTASPGYAAPELIMALQDGNPRTRLRPAMLDTWALGAILYELSTGERQIRGRNMRSIIANTLAGEFNLAKAPAAILPVLEHMLHIHPGCRPSIQDVRDELMRLASNST